MVQMMTYSRVSWAEDEAEGPRILLEYSIIGGKYTSVMNNVERLRGEFG
jgi:hypothetical protein